MRAALTPVALLLAASMASVSARAQDGAPVIVTSAKAEKLSVTVYRAPYRSADDAIDRDNPQGFALISETRTLTIPAGRSVIRFEGVAGNIFPETAILAGLPGGVREKNLDADLLSPRSLYDHALGRRVMLRRTNPATGKMTEEQATIRSSADGAAVIQTGAGNEALRCSGLPETLVYDAVPPGLSARPTLSIETDSATAQTVTLTLSYLAGGFDWQADYVVTLRADGKGADLFGWVTLASNDVTSFAEAGTQVVAGKPNRVSNWNDFGNYGGGSLDLKCWPIGTPTLLPLVMAPPPPPPPPAPMMAMAARAQDIVVTGSARKAVREELGDFKLYRIADPVTVASKAQKQVAFLSNDAVPLTVVYVSAAQGDRVDQPVPTLRAVNRKETGLGIPIPAGKVAVFENAAARPILIGTSATDDKAVGEDIEFKLATSSNVQAALTSLSDKGRTSRYRLAVTNANPWPVAYEAKFDVGSGERMSASGAALVKRAGKLVWIVTLPANGAAALEYSVKRPG
jgi:hypothetical protein